ncbi:MAG: type II secretion system F family protein [Phycisphaerales bacterium]|nr:type II secretion system F family protein [Phycisphaerales bacterium]
MSALTFDYVAIDRLGMKRRGSTPASSLADACRRVAALGLTPLTVQKARSGLAFQFSSGRVSTRALSQFTYQLGVMVSARIPISEGLLSIAQQEQDPKLKAIITDIAKRIQSGEQIATAMDSHRRALGEVYIQTIRAAERSGNLSKVLEHLSDTLEKSQEQTRQVRSAMMYPTCVIVVLVLAVLFLVGFVVPKFAGMFKSRNLDLPVFTELLMSFGLSLQAFWWAYLLGAFGIAAGAWAMWTRPAGRLLLDAILHRIPYINRILVGAGMCRFASIFAVGLQSGLGLIECLDLAGRSAGRPMLMRDVERMIAQVRSGGRLADVLSTCKYLTPFTKRMLIAGEQSAEIPRLCGVISRHYERETTHLAKNLSTIIEPVLIVAIAGVVLVIALAIFLPMWDMAKLVG